MIKEKLQEKGFTLPEGFCVGFSTALVNPPKGVSLAGYGVANAKERLSTENWDELKICCTAFSDGESAFLSFTFDTCHIAECVANPMFRLLEEKIGIPEENVFFNAIHTHAAPVMYTTHPSFPGVPDYQQKVFHPGLIQAATEALLDLTPAKIFAGRGKTEGLSYVRRYLLNDGTYKTNPRGDDVPVAHEMKHDESMQVVRFEREGRMDVVLINWQCHPTSAGGGEYTNTSADWVGVLRNIVEMKKGVHCVYHQGASGPVVAAGKLAGENKFGRDRFREHGELISRVALEILDGEMTPLESGTIKVKKLFVSVPHKDETRGEVKVPATALSLGDLAFATVPYEMFPQNGSYVKENSPFKMTFMCQSTDGDYNYVPSEDVYDHGGYEVRICPFKKGAGETIAEALVKTLKEFAE